MASKGFKADMRDIEFILKEELNIDRLQNIERFGEFGWDDYKMILQEAEKFAAEAIAPINQAVDKEGCRFENGKVSVPESMKNVYKQFREGGWIGMSADPEHGGQGLPGVIAAAANEMFMGACPAFPFTPGLTRGACDLIETFGSDELKKKFVAKMNAGEWAGTMCLTEPQAGSAVGDLKTVARPENGHYRISGTKIFITSGDHDFTDNIVHAVLARIEGAPKGIKGVSLFVVPKIRVNDDGSLGEPNDVVCGGIEHKMGIKSSPTCVLNFGENGGCVGYLLGEENKGIQYMFKMMNEARIYVGLQGMSIAAASFFNALSYAKERVQGVDIRNMKDVDAERVAIIEHPDVRRMLMEMKAYAEGARSMILNVAFHYDLSMHSQDPGERDKSGDFVDLLTPIVKAYISDKSFRVAELGIQVLGGYGYCSEYPQEQYLRDVKIASIYEGANGIQALDLLGRKLGQKGGMTFMAFVLQLNEFIDKNRSHPRLNDLAAKFEAAKNRVAAVAMKLGQIERSGDPIYPVLNATPFLELFGDMATAYFLVRQALIADEKLEKIKSEKGVSDLKGLKTLAEDNPDACYYHSKIQTARFFVHQILPRTLWSEAAILSEDRSALDVVL